MPGCARPVRIFANAASRLCTDFFMRSSDSFRMSLITNYSLFFYKRAFVPPNHDAEQGSFFIHVENTDRHVLVAAQADCSQVHDTEFAVQHFVVGKTAELDGLWILDRISGIHA